MWWQILSGPPFTIDPELCRYCSPAAGPLVSRVEYCGSFLTDLRFLALFPSVCPQHSSQSGRVKSGLRARGSSALRPPWHLPLQRGRPSSHCGRNCLPPLPSLCLRTAASLLLLERAPAGPCICCCFLLERSRAFSPLPCTFTACSSASFRFSLEHHFLNKPLPDSPLNVFSNSSPSPSPLPSPPSCPAPFPPQPSITLQHTMCCAFMKKCIVSVAYSHFLALPPIYTEAPRARPSPCAVRCISLTSEQCLAQRRHLINTCLMEE